MNESLKKSIIFWLTPVVFLSLWYFKEVIIPFLVGLIIGSAIQSLAFYLSYRLKINYYLGVALIYLCFIFLIVITFYFTIKVLIEELPLLLEKVQPYISTLKNLNIKPKWADILSLREYFHNILRFLPDFFSVLSYFFGGFLSLILIFVISLYVSLTKNFPEDIFSLFKLKEEYFKIWRLIRRKISFWFLGEIVLMFFIGLFTYIFFGLILKVKYSLLISLIAGLLEIIPILGPITALIMASIIVYFENPVYVLPTIIFFTILQQLENHLLVPLVMKKAIAINPILIILGILIGAKTGGILGIIIIIPILGSLFEILKRYSHEE